MPTPQINDRNKLAHLAEAHGWKVTEVRHHLTPNADQKANKVLFEVHYIAPEDDAGIIIMYNSIDKMTSAHFQDGQRQDHAHRLVTVEGWLRDYEHPAEDILVGGGKIRLMRNGELYAQAVYHPNGEWTITHGCAGVISVRGLPEPTQRRIIMAALKAM